MASSHAVSPLNMMTARLETGPSQNLYAHVRIFLQPVQACHECLLFSGAFLVNQLSTATTR